MKSPTFYLVCAATLVGASYVPEPGSNLGDFLQIRDATHLIVRTENGRPGRGRSPQREPPPKAALSVAGPAKVYVNGPGSKHTVVERNQWKQVSSDHPTNPYVDGRLLGEIGHSSSMTPTNIHPMKAVAKGRAATAQVSVPNGGHGMMRIKNDQEDRTFQVPGPDSRKLRIQSDHPGGAKVYASVTRPGSVNADAEM